MSPDPIRAYESPALQFLSRDHSQAHRCNNDSIERESSSMNTRSSTHAVTGMPSISAVTRTIVSALATTALAATLAFGVTGPARAQSEASAALSMLPVASVVGGASAVGAGASALSAAPLALSAAGAVFTVKAVEASARGTVYLLERASDGVQVSVEVSGRAVSATGKASAFVVGSAVTASVIAAGTILSAAGEVLAFIPNEIGRALLHNERVTN